MEWFFIWTHLNHLHPRMHWAKFGRNWHSGFPRGDNYEIAKIHWQNFKNLNFFNVFLLFRNYLYLVWPFIWTNLKPFVPSLVEIGPVEKKIFTFRQCIFTDSLEKVQGPSFEQTWTPVPKDALLPNLVEIGSVVL